MVSSAVGMKMRKRVICPIGRIMPPQFSNVYLSSTVSHITEQNLVSMVRLRISLKEKLSTRSSMVDGLSVGSATSDLYRN